ncbi:hypothetical protein JP74_21395 [Devosia sp. 17-2-E-8]|nr:hypothetical protein JP74_21395 [Devosia sp. 17-2-E-8]QMV00187.1 hypothetical protein GHV40_01195 [Devosia sp. D6-9]CDP50957.1 hypothetical protein [Devosia sp. DBB001]
MAKLIVVMGFQRDEEGELQPINQGQEAPSESAAILRAKLMAPTHAGVLAWVRDADPDLGIYGDATVLYRAGEVPESIMEYGGE